MRGRYAFYQYTSQGWQEAIRHYNDAIAIFFLQAEDGIRDGHVTGVQTCALPISARERFLAVVGGEGDGHAVDLVAQRLGQRPPEALGRAPGGLGPRRGQRAVAAVLDAARGHALGA